MSCVTRQDTNRFSTKLKYSRTCSTSLKVDIELIRWDRIYHRINKEEVRIGPRLADKKAPSYDCWKWSHYTFSWTAVEETSNEL